MATTDPNLPPLGEHKVSCAAANSEGLSFIDRTDITWHTLGKGKHRGKVLRIGLYTEAGEQGFVVYDREKVDELITILEYWKRIHD